MFKRGEFVSVQFSGVYLNGHSEAIEVQVPVGDGTYRNFWVPVGAVESADAADKRAKGGA